jgi:ribosomal protein S18 acetylase RimI-like enzyme
MIREIDSNSSAEILLVAQRMRETLLEVLGAEKGKSLYTQDWLVDRVRWHLNPDCSVSKIFLYVTNDNEIIGHAIARIEKDQEQVSFGYFSTIYIEPSFRHKGLAKELMDKVENWFDELNLKKFVYNTAENHSRLIKAFIARGYQITHNENEMVQLTKLK